MYMIKLLLLFGLSFTVFAEQKTTVEDNKENNQEEKRTLLYL